VESEAVKFLCKWQRKHSEERTWKRKQKIFYCFHIPDWMYAIAANNKIGKTKYTKTFA